MRFVPHSDFEDLLCVSFALPPPPNTDFQKDEAAAESDLRKEEEYLITDWMVFAEEDVLLWIWLLVFGFR